MSHDHDAFEYFIIVFQYDPEALESIAYFDDLDFENEYEETYDDDIPDNNF